MKFWGILIPVMFLCISCVYAERMGQEHTAYVEVTFFDNEPIKIPKNKAEVTALWNLNVKFNGIADYWIKYIAVSITTLQQIKDFYILWDLSGQLEFYKSDSNYAEWWPILRDKMDLFKQFYLDSKINNKNIMPVLDEILYYYFLNKRPEEWKRIKEYIGITHTIKGFDPASVF